MGMELFSRAPVQAPHLISKQSARRTKVLYFHLLAAQKCAMPAAVWVTTPNGRA
jgi:hypothetical protein